MTIDLVIFFVFVTSIWIGWTMHIYLDWLRLLWIGVYALVIVTALPYFFSFIDHSSADLPLNFYYGIGICVAALIFFGFYLVIRQNHQASSGVRRVAGCLIFVVVSVLSLMVLLITMEEQGWIDVSQSLILSRIPEELKQIIV
ncbi:hypothetical protein KUV50_06155 [Membranicola marinus]|uniref:Uncharacterized protein n=1 Tax=Membranihabitans marinus TaxID=1227546 RepID=A0A953L9K3_9BACT|nr:hypothetical protein [Membranihabitans marinus]MBY5957703.1 hypothetical protein [Membranihabitans marinus]